MGGHVLGIAVEVDDGSPGLTDRRDEPAGETSAVLAPEGDLLVLQAMTVRSVVDVMVRLIKHAAHTSLARKGKSQDTENLFPSAHFFTTSATHGSYRRPYLSVTR